MSYRDDLDAARHRRESLSRQLDDVRARLGDRDALMAEERRLAAEIEEARANIDHARRRVELPRLRDVRIANPCKESWETMAGDDRARFYRRADGTVMTSDCPEGQRWRRRRRNLVLAGALAASSIAAGGTLVVGEEAQDDERMGEVTGGAVAYPERMELSAPAVSSDVDAMLPDHPSLTDPNWKP